MKCKHRQTSNKTKSCASGIVSIREFPLWIATLRGVFVCVKRWDVYHLRLSVLLRFLLLFIHFNFVYFENKLGTNTWRVAPSATCEIVAQIKLAQVASIVICCDGLTGPAASLLCRTQSRHEFQPSPRQRTKTNENFYLCIFSVSSVSVARERSLPTVMPGICEFELIRLLSCSFVLSRRTHHNKHHNVLRDTSVLLLFTLTRFATTSCLRMPRIPLARTFIHVFNECASLE